MKRLMLAKIEAMKLLTLHRIASSLHRFIASSLHRFIASSLHCYCCPALPSIHQPTEGRHRSLESRTIDVSPNNL
jgi:hypothetical protein